MGGVSWVAGSTGITTTGTSITATTPAGIQDGDGLIAWVVARASVTPPAGWTLIASVDVTASSVTQTLHCYEKDTVVAGNSSTSYTFTQSSSLTHAICYQVVRAESGVVVFRGAGVATNTGATTVTPAAVTMDRGQEMVLICGSTVVQTDGSFAGTPPTGFIMSTGSVAGNRSMACYHPDSEGYSNSGTFTVASTGSSNGTQAITIRATDQEEVVAIDEGIDIALAEDLSGSTYGIVSTETVGVHHVLGTLFEDTLADGASVVDAVTAILPQIGLLTDVASVIPLVTVTNAIQKTLSDTVGMTLALTYTAGTIWREGVALRDAALANHKAQQSIADVIRIAETLSGARPLTIAEAVGVAEALQAARAVVLLQELGIAESVAPAVQYRLSLTQGLRVHSALGRFLGADATENLGFVDTPAERMFRTGLLADTIGVAAAVTPHLLINVVTSDEIEITPAQALGMILRQTVLEGVDISAGYVAPDGTFTTWAMNTRTGAVSEYTNYEFNSFARIGNKYVGASSDGLYELLGDTDDGTDIVAQLKGGFLQFGGTHLSRLKAAYIAADGVEGDYILRVETKDGAVYDYRIAARNGRSSQFHMGKGQRSRYFAYTLTSVGQDFTLDTLEFVPVVLQRRV